MDGTVAAIVIFGILGCLLLEKFITEQQCADAAISDKPPKWWRDALIDAKIRAEKAKEE